MTKSPAFQFYPGDFLSDGNQMVMELDEAGAYIRLLCVCWLEGNIPNDLRKLAKMAGTTLKEMQRVWPAIAPCFETDPVFVGYLTHPRLEKERAKQASFREKAKQAGKKSAELRNARSTPVEGPLAPSTNSNPTLQSSSSSSSSLPDPNPTVGSRKKKKRAIPTYSPAFQGLWDQHREGSKADAFKEYTDALESGVTHETIDRGLKSYRRDKVRPGFDGVHLCRFIRDRRWEQYEPKASVTPIPRPQPQPQPEGEIIPPEKLAELMRETVAQFGGPRQAGVLELARKLPGYKS